MASRKFTVLTAALLLGGGVARADVSISSKPTSNMTCDSGVCTATAAKAVLNVGDLQTMLAGGDVAVKTGTLAKDIDIAAPLTWSNTSRLTLDAQQSVTIKKQVTVSGTGALTITTNDGGSGGDLLFQQKGSVTFWDTASSLVINGQSYTLVKDIATLAADIAANPSGLYALANSYDAKHDRFERVPIPTEFTGTFEGLGQSLVHVRIKRDLKNWEGLFAISDGKIRDIDLKKVYVSSNSDGNGVGALVGLNRGTITNAAVDGSVQGSANLMGGVAGMNMGQIVNTTATVDVLGDELAGGLAGDSRNGTIINSHARGDVFGNVAGGLVGNGANILLSSAAGSVTGGDGARVGGLAGVGENIDQSYSTGAVTGGSNDVCIGGLVGIGSYTTNSYAFGAVIGGTGKVWAGGFGGCGSNVLTSYSIGPASAGKHSQTGGFLGKGDNHSFQDYWDVDTSGLSQACGNDNCANVTGLTTAQLHSGLPAGFDPKIWGENSAINNGYPYLLANRPQ